MKRTSERFPAPPVTADSILFDPPPVRDEAKLKADALTAIEMMRIARRGYDPAGMTRKDADFVLNDADANKREALVAGYRGYSYSELKDRPPPKALLRTSTCIIPYGFVEIYSKPGTGKSTFDIELQICATAGALFHGAQLDIGRRHLYFAAEGGSGVPQRVAKVLDRRGIDVRDIEGWRMVEKPLDLTDARTVDAAFKANPGAWDTVSIDTLAQSMTGDENSTQDMNKVVRTCKHIRETYCPNLRLLHHEGRHADHARGSIALDAATDCQLRLATNADGLTAVIVARLRDYGRPENPVTLFKLKDGLLEPATAGIGDREDRMLAVLSGLGDDVSPAQWRGACEDLLDAATDDAKAKQWERAIGRLRAAKRIKVTGKTSAQRVEILAPTEFQDAEDFGS